jgi:mannose-6-phosphate isomerase-like protein (cupin superfamily)
MGDVTRKDIEEIEYDRGPNAIPGIKFHAAARALGVTAWEMSVLEIEADCTRYPEHDHVKDGQEEVYVVLRGSATIHAAGAEHAMKVGTFVRVGPSEKRKIIPGPDGTAVLAIGSTPGKAHAPRK